MQEQKSVDTYINALSTDEVKELKQQVERAIDNHYRFRRYYIRSSPSSRRECREMETKHSFAVSFFYKGNRYRYYSSVTCYEYIVYRGRFEVNGEKSTVRSFNKVLKELKQILGNCNE